MDSGECSVSTGALVVAFCGLAFFWLPTVGVVDLEVLFGGILAGWLVGDLKGGAFAGISGGFLIGAVWALLALVVGDPGSAGILVVMMTGNGAAGGTIGGWLAD